MGPSTILAPWCEKIARDSGQRMKCQVYPSMKLGGAPLRLVDQARSDALPADLRKVLDDNSGAALSAAIGKTWDASAPRPASPPLTGSRRDTIMVPFWSLRCPRP
jgi:hypothetical protein